MLRLFSPLNVSALVLLAVLTPLLVAQVRHSPDMEREQALQRLVLEQQVVPAVQPSFRPGEAEFMAHWNDAAVAMNDLCADLRGGKADVKKFERVEGLLRKLLADPGWLRRTKAHAK